MSFFNGRNKPAAGSPPQTGDSQPPLLQDEDDQPPQPQDVDDQTPPPQDEDSQPPPPQEVDPRPDTRKHVRFEVQCFKTEYDNPLSNDWRYWDRWNKQCVGLPVKFVVYDAKNGRMKVICIRDRTAGFHMCIAFFDCDDIFSWKYQQLAADDKDALVCQSIHRHLCKMLLMSTLDVPTNDCSKRGCDADISDAALLMASAMYSACWWGIPQPMIDNARIFL